MKNNAALSEMKLSITVTKVQNKVQIIIGNAILNYADNCRQNSKQLGLF